MGIRVRKRAAAWRRKDIMKNKKKEEIPPLKNSNKR